MNSKRWDHGLPVTPTNELGCFFYGAFLILVLKVLFPGKPLSPWQTKTVGIPAQAEHATWAQLIKKQWLATTHKML